MDFEAYERTGYLAYADLAEAIAGILVAAIERQGDLRLQQVQHRAKSAASLRRKLERAGALRAEDIERPPRTPPARGEPGPEPRCVGPLLESVEIILSSMGVTTGEFGQVAGLERKRTELGPWREDPRQRVRSFAERYLRTLDRLVASEQQRAEERLALGKLEYEPSEEDGAG